MNPRISLLAPKGERKYEGTRNIAEKLKVLLERKGFDITNKFVKNADFYHVISNGFLEAIQYKKIRKKAIYSLLTNIDVSTKWTFWWFKEAVKERRIRDQIYRIGRVAATSLIPLSVKRKAIANYRYITVPTQCLKKTLGIKKVCIIPIGIDVKRFRRTRKGEGVAFFGASTLYEGYSDLYRAARLIDKKIPVRFYFRGDEGKMRTLMKGENIEVLGTQENIVKAYNENSIVVLPFRLRIASIDIPLTLLEAMACERAIITTGFPNIKEAAGDSVLYVNPYAPEQIKEKIEILVDDKQLRHRLGKKARKRVLKYYAEKCMCDGFLKLYKSLMKS